MKLGILMDGGEEAYVNTVRGALQNAVCDPPTYLEIGVAYGETLKGVVDATRDIAAVERARFFGIELHEWPAWNEIDMRVGHEPDVEMIRGRSTEVLAAWNRGLISCALIDACHGGPCVTADFLAVEPHIAPGGLVIFHDAGEREQGIDLQPHCNQPIQVRKALSALGLFANTRLGWSFRGMLPTANACAVFEKHAKGGE